MTRHARRHAEKFDFKGRGRQYPEKVVGCGGIAPQDYQGVAWLHFLETVPNVQQ